MLDSSILIFTKIPFLTDCKTRLQKSGNFSKEQTNLLATAFLLDTIKVCKSINPKKIFLSTSPKIEKNQLLEILRKIANLENEFLNEIHLFPQEELEFYQRLEIAKRYCLENEPSDLIIIGSDSPHINTNCFLEAKQIMAENKYAIGETFDGGFFLLGIPKNLSSNKDLSHMPKCNLEEVSHNLSQLLSNGSNLLTLSNKLRDIDEYSDFMHVAKSYQLLI